MSKSPNLTKSIYILTSLLFLALVIAISAFFYFIQPAQKSRSVTEIATISSQPEDIDRVEPTAAPTRVVQKPEFFYRIDIAPIAPGSEPTEEEYRYLGEYLLDRLNLSDEVSYANETFSIHYDVREGNPTDNGASKFDHTYFVATVVEIEAPQTLQDEYTTIQITPLDADMSLYLASNYCQVDADCSIRNSVCSYGAYNHYQGYLEVFGCGPATDDTGYRFGEFDEALGCVTDVTYAGATCVQNQCQGVDRQVICKENAQ